MIESTLRQNADRTGADRTTDPAARSWVTSANGHPDFPIQNLPLGIFGTRRRPPRAGVAIGDLIVDLPALAEAGLIRSVPPDLLEAPSLNRLLALPGSDRAALRAEVFDWLLARPGAGKDVPGEYERMLHGAEHCTMHLPAVIGDYTDFFAGIHHATNAGKMFRPDTPLLPNYKYVPIGYHGRGSSIRASGAAVRRPRGQRKPASETVPSFGPCRNLDYEMELGIWIGGPANRLGDPVPIGEAHSRIAGFCLLNDWSARDIQGWEYQPLGPFLAKSFHTSLSPWIVLPEALAPFRIAQPPRPEGDPAPLDYLASPADQQRGALDISVEVWIETEAMRAAAMPPHMLSVGSTRDLYWTVAQLVAHQTSAGCDLHAGDLFGSGTISGLDEGSLGSLLEISQGGRRPIELPSGEVRRFLEDGDEIIMRGFCDRQGATRIGFGECRGRIVPALS